MKFVVNILYSLLFVLLLFSCKATKSTSGNIKNLNTYKILSGYHSNITGAQLMKGQFNVQVTGKNDIPLLNVTFRMQKDSAIWMSFSKFGLAFGKILIQPNRVRFYEKINHSYFDGDFKLISNWIGTDMNFTRVQNLFLGKAIADLNPDELFARISDGFYILQTRKNANPINMTFKIDPYDFSLREQIFELPSESKKLRIVYTYSNKKESLNLPLGIQIDATGEKNHTRIQIEYKRIDALTRISFPFRIPKGYKEIKLK